MSLSKEKIVANAKKFHDTGNKYGFLTDELMNLLGTDFVGAPASANIKLFGAFEGGLVNHILTATKFAVKFNEMLPEDKRVPVDSLIKVCFLHQIGKAKMFKLNPSDWHRKNLGDEYTWNDEVLPVTTASRSIYYALSSGISLSEDEVYAINNYDSDFSNRPMAKLGEKLAAILRTANLLAVIEEKMLFSE